MVKMNKRVCGIFVSSALAMLATGCATTQKVEENVKKGDEQISKSFSVAEEKVQKNAFFKKEKGFWVNPEPLPSYAENAGVALPDVFYKKAPATFPGNVNLNEIVAELSRLGMPVEVAMNAYPSTGATVSQIMVSDFVHRGDLKTALDVLTRKLGLFWKYQSGKVVIFKYETRNFYVSALAGSSSINSTVSMEGSATSSGTNSSAGGSSSAGVTSTASIATWADVKSYIQSRLTPGQNGGTVAIMESSGMINVKDTPLVLEEIGQAIKELNALLTKQIHMNIEVYSVTRSDADNYGFDMNALWSTINSKFSLAYTSAAYKGLGSTAANIVAASSYGVLSGTNAANMNILQGPWKGTDFFLNALSSLGNAKLENKFPLITTNGQSLPVLINNEQAYLKSMKTTPSTTQGVAPTVEMEPGVVNSGMGLNVLPKIQPNGEILLKFNMSLSELVKITEITAGSNKIQLPERNVKNIEQRVTMKSGESLILAGFQQEINSLDKAGVGSPSNVALGGHNNAKIAKQHLIIVITPYVQNNNKN